MKKLLLILVFCFNNITLLASEPEMKFIREHFYMAVEDENALIRLEKYINRKYSTNMEEYSPVILAYRGGVEALKAKYVFSPFAKFSYVVNSLEILDKAVSKLSDDLEVRFLRYSILDNIPSFLGYGAERKADKEEVIRQLLKNDFSGVDMKTQKGIIDYLMDSGNLTDEEERLLTSKCIAYKQ